MAEHRNLTGADLHEPKGAETALSGTVYQSDGSGSGQWVKPSAQNTVVSDPDFTAGNVLEALKELKARIDSLTPPTP